MNHYIYNDIYIFHDGIRQPKPKDSITCLRKKYLKVVLNYWQKGCKDILNKGANYEFKWCGMLICMKKIKISG